MIKTSHRNSKFIWTQFYAFLLYNLHFLFIIRSPTVTPSPLRAYKLVNKNILSPEIQLILSSSPSDVLRPPTPSSAKFWLLLWLTAALREPLITCYSTPGMKPSSEFDILVRGGDESVHFMKEKRWKMRNFRKKYPKNVEFRERNHDWLTGSFVLSGAGSGEIRKLRTEAKRGRHATFSLCSEEE